MKLITVFFMMLIVTVYGGNLAGAQTASDVDMSKVLTDVWKCAIPSEITRVENISTNGKYVFISGYTQVGEKGNIQRIPKLAIVNESGVLSCTELKWPVTDIAAVGDHLYALYSIYDKMNMSDASLFLKVFDVSNPKEPRLLESELVFPANTGDLVADQNDLIIMAQQYGGKNIVSQIYRVGLSDPANPVKLASGYIDIVEKTPLRDTSGKIIRSDAGKVKYKGIKRKYSDIPDEINTAYISGDYLYAVTGSELWSFDLEGRNKEGIKADPEENSPLFMGKILDSYTPITYYLDSVYSVSKSDLTGSEAEPMADSYFFLVGSRNYTFDQETMKFPDNQEYKATPQKYGVLVLSSEHITSLSDEGDTKKTWAMKTSCTQFPEKFKPLHSKSFSNWLLSLGYTEVQDSPKGHRVLKGTVCLMDANDPNDVKITGVLETGWLPWQVEWDGNTLYVLEEPQGLASGEKILHKMQVNLEPKGFKRISHPVTQADQAKYQERQKNMPPRGYVLRYRGNPGLASFRNPTRYMKPQTQEVTWMYGYQKMIIVHDWSEAPKEIWETMKHSFGTCSGGT